MSSAYFSSVCLHTIFSVIPVALHKGPDQLLELSACVLRYSCIIKSTLRLLAAVELPKLFQPQIIDWVRRQFLPSAPTCQNCSG